MEPTEDLRGHFKTSVLIAVTIVASLLIYLGLVEVIRSINKPFLGFAALSDVQLIRYIFYGGAALIIILIRILRPVLLKRTPLDDEKTLIHKLSRSALITVILSEIPALLGLILFFLGGLNRDFYALLFVSLILVFIHFPRLRSWEEWISQK
jgi:hypothetical protein